MTKLHLTALNALSQAEFVSVLGPTVEHAAWIADRVAAQRPFASLAALFAAMRDVILRSDRDVRLALLRGHPELAGLAARSGSMTAESQGEQSGAGLDALSSDRARIFEELNAAYAARHGFPFVIAVRRHGTDSILREFRRRVDEGRDAEIETALSEILHIVALRLDATLEGDETLPVAGHLSTHVLDTHAGVPAVGVAVELFEMPATGAPRLLGRSVTNEAGRTHAPLIAGRPVPIATYELRFGMGDYFRARGATLASPPFLDIVPIRFAVAEPEGRYHVPLTATPWSYATYRGS